jgi:hypothetical protein
MDLGGKGAVSSSGTGTDAKPKDHSKTMTFAPEQYHYIVGRLRSYTPKAVGACKHISAFLSTSFGSGERVSLIVRLWQAQRSVLSHHHRRDAGAFVLAPLLLTSQYLWGLMR